MYVILYSVRTNQTRKHKHKACSNSCQTHVARHKRNVHKHTTGPPTKRPHLYETRYALSDAQKSAGCVGNRMPESKAMWFKFLIVSYCDVSSSRYMFRWKPTRQTDHNMDLQHCTRAEQTTQPHAFSLFVDGYPRRHRYWENLCPNAVARIGCAGYTKQLMSGQLTQHSVRAVVLQSAETHTQTDRIVR